MNVQSFLKQEFALNQPAEVFLPKIEHVKEEKFLQGGVHNQSNHFLNQANKVLMDSQTVVSSLDKVAASVRQGIEIIQQKTKALVRSFELKIQQMVKTQDCKTQSKFGGNCGLQREIEAFILKNQHQLVDFSQQTQQYLDTLKRLHDYRPQKLKQNGMKNKIPNQKLKVIVNPRTIEYNCQEVNLGFEQFTPVMEQFIGCTDSGVMAFTTRDSTHFFWTDCYINHKYLLHIRGPIQSIISVGNHIITDTIVFEFDGKRLKEIQTFEDSDIFHLLQIGSSSFIASTKKYPTVKQFEFRDGQYRGKNRMPVKKLGANKDNLLSKIKMVQGSNDRFFGIIKNKEIIRSNLSSMNSEKLLETDIVFKQETIIDYVQSDEIYIIVMLTDCICIVDQFTNTVAHQLRSLLQPQQSLHLAPMFDIDSLPIIIIQDQDWLGIQDILESGAKGRVGLITPYQILGQIGSNPNQLVLMGRRDKKDVNLLIITFKD